MSFLGGSDGKEFAFNPWIGKIPYRRKWKPTPVFWPGEFHGLYSPWGHKKSDTTEQLSLSVEVFGTAAPCHVQLFATLWTIACQTPLSMGSSRQEYWSEFPFPSPGDFSDPGNTGFLYCRQTLYHLSHQESPFSLVSVQSLSHVRLFVTP